MRKTKKVRIKIDFVLILDDEVDSVPIGSNWVDTLPDTLGASIAIACPKLVNKGQMGPTRVSLSLDFRKE